MTSHAAMYAFIDEFFYPRRRPPLKEWHRSRSGNLTRLVGSGTWLTVFERPAGSGRYAWSLKAGTRRPRYSAGCYSTEDAAVRAVEAEAEP